MKAELVRLEQAILGKAFQGESETESTGPTVERWTMWYLTCSG
jgi:hypothetical protein